MSWPRAVLSAVIAVAVAFLALVVVPDLLLSQVTSVARSQRVALATAWFAFALVVILWGLRRLQQRHIV
jgi:hypothetical protein